MTHEIRGSLKLNPGAAPTAAKGVLYYDTSTDEFKGCTDGATFGSIGGGGTLQDAYDGGNSIAVVTNPLAITQAAGANSSLTVGQSGTGSGIAVTMSDSGGASGFQAFVTGSGYAFRGGDNGGTNEVRLGGGDGQDRVAYIYRNLTGSTNPMLDVNQANAGETGNVVQITQAATGAGYAMQMSTYGTASAISINAFGMSLGNATVNIQEREQGANTNNVQLAVGGDSSRKTGWFVRNLDSTHTAQPVVHIDNQNSGDDQITLKVDSAITSGASAFQATQNSGTSYTGRFYGGGGNNTVFLAHSGGNQAIYALRNQNSTATSGSVVRIQNANTGDDQPSLYVYHQSTGNALQMLDYGTGQSISLSRVGSATSTSPIFNISRANSNHTGNTIQLYEYNARANTNMHSIYMFDYTHGASTYDIYIGTATQNLSGLANFRIFRNVNTSAMTSGPLMQLTQQNSSDVRAVLRLDQAATSIPVIDFNGCTTQGTGHTSISESIAVRGPSGTVRYINLYS